ncbi:MAG: acyl-CoA-binding protein [Bacteroidota bacterium]|nr:acyl-CoA-binding protein [Bacteroidota bacterium]
MSISTFEEAVKESKNLNEKPSNDVLLKLYALYKQATEGDVSGERPGGFDFKGAAKYDAWEKQKGVTTDKAKEEYISFVKELHDNQ